jgi:flagellar hook protein FlgE
MSLYSAFYASLSGLSSNANALGVIGNNLANLNTIGYKASTVNFEDLYSSALSGSSIQGNGDPMQIGLGASLASVSQDFSQGSPQATGTVTNMALQGDGFFTLQTLQGGAGYTRSGNFSPDKNGYLVDPSGNYVMGWNAVNGVVNATGTPSKIFLNPGAVSPPVPTSTISNTTNLDSASATGTTFTAPISVYDSQGASHNIEITYTKTANAGEWSTAVKTDDPTVTVTGTNGYGASPNNLIQFNPDGSLKTPASGANPVLTLSAWASGATSPAITVDVWSGNPASSSLTSYAQTSGTASTTQNGYAAGSVSGMSVDTNGNIIGTFTNGQTMALAQVAVSTFSNNNGLVMTGSNVWNTTLSSGSANVGAANTGGRAAVLGSNLESSNVDVATEFTKLIINQNGYQANSRVITTANTLLQTVISLIQG